MPRIVLCVALLCALAQSSGAMELGESREQLLAKHGAPGAEDRTRNVAMYFWDGWSAQVEFEGNTIGRITYRRNWYLGDSEIAALLQANGGADRWREVPAAIGQNRQWSRNDGAVATCLRLRPLSLVIQTASMFAAKIPEPKVIIPATPDSAVASTAPFISTGSATPAPPYTKAPTYPRMLGTPTEPELPVADPPALQEQPPQQHLPKLPTAEVPPEPSAASAANPRTVPAPQPEASRPPVAQPVPDLHPSTAETGSHALLYTLAVMVLAALAGGVVYFRRRRVPAEAAPTIESLVREAAARQPAVKTKSTKPDPASSIPVPEAVAKLATAREVSPGETAAPAPAPKTVSGVDALRLDQFEMLIAEIFRRQDYTVELSAAMSADGAIDVTLRRDSETILVQCKHWKLPRVTDRELREFYAVMTDSGAPRGVIVTTGEFSPSALAFAEGKSIELMDGQAVVECLAAVARPGEDLLRISSWIEEFMDHARIFDPECPVCHGTMTVRHNRATGTPTWCCRGYPRCPGRREPRLDLLPSAAAHP